MAPPQMLALGFLIVLGPLLFRTALRYAPWLEPLEGTFTFFRFAVATVVLVIALFVAHKWLPAGRRRVVEILPGIVATLVLWLAAGVAFGRYLAEFSFTYVNYLRRPRLGHDRAVFLYWTASIFVYGGELNSALCRRHRRNSPGVGERSERDVEPECSATTRSPRAIRRSPDFAATPSGLRLLCRSEKSATFRDHALPDIGDALLGLCLNCIGGLGRKLKHRGFLAFDELGQENRVPVGKFECIMMHPWLVLVHLPEDRRLVADRSSRPIPESRMPANAGSCEKASSVPGRTQTAVVTSSGAANPFVPVPKLRVVSLSPTLAERDFTCCRL